MDQAEDVDDLLHLVLLLRVPVLELRERDGLQGVLGPVLVEVDSRAVDDRGEVQQLGFEVGAERTHAQQHVQVALD